MANIGPIWPEICTDLSQLMKGKVMTPVSDPKILDENSVFTRMFSEQKRPRKATPSERLSAIFEQPSAEEAPIKVADFLPRY